MNKKLLLAMALPTVLVGCSQDDFMSETPVAPEGKAISGLTFTIEKNGLDADTRALWQDNNTIKFETDDNISLYWISGDGLAPAAAEDGTFTGTASVLPAGTALIGKSNAVFYTEDGSKFESKAVVYEGYNLLVYPANTTHVTDQAVVVTLPATQKAEDDFTKNLVYVGDSILQIHQPALKASNNKYYDMWNQECATDAPNTSGYQHGIKAGVKLMSSLLKLKFVIENTSATDVKIQKVELTTVGGTDKLYSVEGNIVPGALLNLSSTNTGSKSKYINPWFQTTTAGQKETVALDCSNIATTQSGTEVQMVLFPVAVPGSWTSTNQPVIKVTTNYGVVTIGGNVAAGGDAHSNCIFKANGVDYAADDDNTALQTIVGNTAMTVQRSVYDKTATSTNKIAKYNVTSGSVISRVIKVDMQKAVVQDMYVNNTAELNAVLAAACTKSASTYNNTSKKLNINLNFDHYGNFELTDYTGLDAFATKFGADALNLAGGNCTSKASGAATALANINLNTTDVTALKNIAGLPNTITITVPATSAITSIANGTRTTANVITSEIVNEKTLSAGSYTKATVTNTEAILNLTATSNIKLSDNEDGIVNYAAGATLDVSLLTTAAAYGTIAYSATTYDNMVAAMKAGANKVTISNIQVGFFSNGIDAKDAAYPADGAGLTGVEVVFDNCGDLKDLKSLEATTVTLKGGTKCTGFGSGATAKTAVVWNLYGTTTFGATLAAADLNTQSKRQAISKVRVMEGTATINAVQATHLAVFNGATATLTTSAWTPTNLAVEGTVTYNATGDAGKLQLNTTTNKIEIKTQPNASAKMNELVVTGNFTTSKDIIATTVWVGSNTTITLSGDIKGVATNNRANSGVVKATKYEQIAGTANFYSFATNEQIWSGETSKWAATGY